MGKYARRAGLAALGVAGGLILIEAGRAQNDKGDEYREALAATAQEVAYNEGKPVDLSRFRISQKEFDGPEDARDEILGVYGVLPDSTAKERAAASCLLLTAGNVTWEQAVVDAYTAAIDVGEAEENAVEAANAYTAVGDLCITKLPNNPNGVILNYINGYPEE